MVSQTWAAAAIDESYFSTPLNYSAQKTFEDEEIGNSPHHPSPTLLIMLVPKIGELWRMDKLEVLLLLFFPVLSFVRWFAPRELE